MTDMELDMPTGESGDLGGLDGGGLGGQDGGDDGCQDSADDGGLQPIE